MIVTVTMNPATDQTFLLETVLLPGNVHQVTSSISHPGGKGINVSRALHQASVPTCAVFPAGPGDTFVASLEDLGFALYPVPATYSVRTNITIVDPSGQTTKINTPGNPMTAQSVQALCRQVATLSQHATWLVCAGSLPPGLPEDFYVQLIQIVRQIAPEIHVAVDTSGAPLAALIQSDQRIDVIKPNGEELYDVACRLGLIPAQKRFDESDHRAGIALARLVLPPHIRTALITLGAHGALMVRAQHAWATKGRAANVLSTVGAGDSALAGYLIGLYEQADEASCLALAAGYGVVAVSLAGTEIPKREAVTLEHIDVVEHK